LAIFNDCIKITTIYVIFLICKEFRRFYDFLQNMCLKIDIEAIFLLNFFLTTSNDKRYYM
jgi:hypothetical protein